MEDEENMTVSMNRMVESVEQFRKLPIYLEENEDVAGQTTGGSKMGWYTL